MGEETKEGWGKPPSSRKWHFFRDGTSLCRRWGFAYELPLEPDDGAGDPARDCSPCTTALEKERT